VLRATAVLASVLVAAATLGQAGAEQEVRLEYVARYRTHDTYHDHLMGVEQVGAHHALVSSNLDIVIVDLDALPAGGTDSYVFRLAGLSVNDTTTREDGYVFANLRLGGFAVIRFDAAALTLAHLKTVAEPGVYYEKMFVSGDRLYVAAHAHGIRIFDVADPADPELVGSLEQGFDDAFAIAVSGSTAYVADGAGGLKIVDVSNESAPAIVAGEDPQAAAGGAQDVIVVGPHVYLACGGAGVAHYASGDLQQRTLYPTPGMAEQFARVGDHLAVTDIAGVELFSIDADGSLARVAGEAAMRRSLGGTSMTLRLWHGVDAWGENRILAANWDSMDVYEIVDPALHAQPDLTVSDNRLRFAPQGGTTTVRLHSQGAADLRVTSIEATEPTFVAGPPAAVLEPGEHLDVTVQYLGNPPGRAMVLIGSDDPDESPMPIEVYGDTPYLDPGEPAVPFTLESWTFDHEMREFVYGTFDLAAHAGRVIYFHVFGLG
jgi:hypothetical protein